VAASGRSAAAKCPGEEDDTPNAPQVNFYQR
jgi:hypothetical protein